jgi:hypothetical protein
MSTALYRPLMWDPCPVLYQPLPAFLKVPWPCEYHGRIYCSQKFTCYWRMVITSVVQIYSCCHAWIYEWLVHWCTTTTTVTTVMVITIITIKCGATYAHMQLCFLEKQILWKCSNSITWKVLKIWLHLCKDAEVGRLTIYCKWCCCLEVSCEDFWAKVNTH